MGKEEILNKIKEMADPAAAAGMTRFGITTRQVYGVTVPKLRALAKETGRDHRLAGELWEIDSRETRLLAGMVEELSLVTEEQAETWALDFDNWEICDGTCMNVFEKTPFAYKKCLEWSERYEEFVKRAGFVLMARLAVSDKKAVDDDFTQFFPVIITESTDDRDLVKKAVNWALRQIGKRNHYLNERAIAVAREIQELDLKSARWIAADALRELQDPAILARIKA